MSTKSQLTDKDSIVEQYRALLAVTEAIISHRDLGVLFHDLSEHLKAVISFDYTSVLLYEPTRNVMRLSLLETPLETSVRTGWETSIEGSASGFVWQTQQPLIVDDINSETRFPDTLDVLRARHQFALFVPAHVGEQAFRFDELRV